MTNQPDEVDQLIADWQRERPDLDLSPLQVLSRVSRLARHLEIGRRKAFSNPELELWEFDVLAALRRSGKSYALTPSSLISENLVTSGTMTNRVDRLVERGLVVRQSDPNDGRGVLVKLTSEGKKAVDQAISALVEIESNLLKSLPKSEQKQLADLLRVLTSSVATNLD